MSESVEDDDNMLVLVVEDDYKEIQAPMRVQIKVEPLDNSVKDTLWNEILNSLATEKDADIVKEVYCTEYLEEHEEDTEEYNIEYLEEEYDDDDHKEDDQVYIDQKTKKNKKKTWKRKPPFGYISYVEQLRIDNPMMANNEQLLIKHLANEMRDARPPTPPDNYCKSITDEDGKNKYVCTFCETQKNTLPLAARHFQFKHGDTYLTCYACGSRYKNTTSLYKHEKRCRAPDAAVVLRARGEYLGRKGRGRPFTTDNRFITGQMLALEHAKSSSPHSPPPHSRLFCTKCPASFSHRDNLEAHENSHAGLRPFPCTQCAAAYTSYRALKRHLSAVHGDERYICDHCGKKFRVKPALISHLDTHRPVRKHPCMYCERRFAQKTALQHHMNKKHLNLPPAHGCPVCPKRYARLTHVKEHMARAHGLMMITRNMFFQSLPKMSEEQVIEARHLFNFGVTQISEPNHIVSELLEEPDAKKPETGDTALVSDTRSLQATSRLNTDDLSHDDEIKEQKSYLSHSKKELNSFKGELNTIITNEMDDDDKTRFKKKRKSVIPSVEKKKGDNDEKDEVADDIKKVLSSRKKGENIQKKNLPEIHELNCGVVDNLNCEIEMPDPAKDKLENLGSKRKSLKIYNLQKNVSTMKQTDDVVLQNAVNDADTANDEDSKDYSDESVKNKVINDFLEYMRSGVVPKLMPPLLPRRRSKKW